MTNRQKNLNNSFKTWLSHSKIKIERPCYIRYFSLPAILLITFLIGGCAGEFEDPFEDPVEKFLGNWKATETSSVFGSGYVYDVNISRIPGRFSEVFIQNFYMQGQDQRARALVTGNNLNIFEQKIANGTITIKGSGQFSGGVITINYTANSGADLDVVTAILRRPA